MNAITLPRLSILLVALSVALGALAKDLNLIDASGNRQGYWVIKGIMLNDRSYQPDAIVEEGNYKNNLKEGLWKKYWPGGKLKSEITYSYGKPDGPYSVYYESGQVEETATWKNGKNTGVFKRYYENGNPQQDFVFAENGKRNGLQKYFHENGVLALEVKVDNGSENGPMKRYSEDGRLIEESIFTAGTVKPGSVKEYTDRSNSSDNIADAHNENLGKESVATKDEPNGAAMFKPNGYNSLYDQGNQITQVGQFKNGRLWDGKWYRYNPEGILIRIEIYKSGRYIGTGILSEESD